MFFNYMHTPGYVSCAASTFSPIQALKAGEHLVKKSF